MAKKELQPGDSAPEFVLPAGAGRGISLKDFRNRKKVVLYFYPKDDTPGCTREACAFRDDLAKYDQTDTVILGVSADGVESHAKFTAKYQLPFTLLSDEGSKVAKAYGVYRKKTLYGRTCMGIERSTFVIDQNGKIAHICRNVKVDGHSADVLNFLAQ